MEGTGVELDVIMGEVFALCAAMTWAIAVVLFKRTGEHIPPFDLNLFRVVFSSVALLVILGAMGQPVWGQAPLEDYLILFLSGIIAIAISDTLFHHSLNLVGAGINAIIDCLYSPFVVLLGYVLLGEELGLMQLGGMGLVLAGVLVASRRPDVSVIPQKKLIMGIVWGGLAMFTLALGIVIAKPVLDRSPVLWATTIRQIACLGVMVPLALISRRRRRIFSVFRPAKSWKYAIPGTIFGSVLALIFWISGMKYTNVGIAAILNQTSTFYILILATLILKETFERRKWIASFLAVAGIALVIFG